MKLDASEITRENWRKALDLSVKPEQQRFLARYSPVALVGLSKAYVHDLGFEWKGLLLCVGSVAVGFTMTAFDPSHPADHWIFHFFIDSRFQGKGFGFAGLQETVNQIRATHPECCRICLTVHPENLAAQSLYKKAGFETTGEQRFGEPVYGLPLRAH